MYAENHTTDAVLLESWIFSMYVLVVYFCQHNYPAYISPAKTIG